MAKSARRAWTFLLISSVLLLGVITDFAGMGETLSVVANGVGAAVFVAAAVNNRRLRPMAILLIAGLVFAALSLSLREVLGVNGNLGPTRSLIPDVFGVGGYLSWFAMLILYSRGRHQMDRSRYLDAALFGLTFITVDWVLFIGPKFVELNAAVPAQLSFTIYLPAVAAQAFLAARLVTADSRPSAADLLIFSACAFQVVGEVLYTVHDLQLVSFPQLWGQAPYAAMPLLLAGALLHPSVLVRSSRPAKARTSKVRLALMLAALLVPQAVLLARPAVDGGVRTVAAGMVAAGAIIALIRIREAVTSEERSRVELSRYANYDELTGRWNRRSFIVAAEERIAGNDGLVMLAVDVERFKQINDTMGQTAGDNVLIAVANTIGATAGVVELGRVAGDEFLALADPAAAEAIIVRLNHQPIQTGFGDVFINVRVGQADVDGDAETAIKHASLALATAKTQSSNLCAYSSAMGDIVKQRAEMERNLRHALRNGDITTHLQPIVSLETGELRGFEALARWNHNGEWVRPDHFIAVAEESGLIIDLGYHILTLSCETLARWAACHPAAKDLYVSVNLSPRQLRDPSLVSTVERILTTTGVERKNVWLEITETMLIEDDRAAGAVLDKLVDLGVSLALDDFGKGHSSLSYLHMFPIRRVKIDKSFVDHVADNQRSRALVDAVISMSKALDLKTVAEGIETVEQAVALASLGADYGQGYLFSRPYPAGELERHWPELGAPTPAATPVVPQVVAA